MYEETGDWSKVYKYIYELREWKDLKTARENGGCDESFPGSKGGAARPLQQIIQMIEHYDPRAPTVISSKYEQSTISSSSTPASAFNYSTSSSSSQRMIL